MHAPIRPHLDYALAYARQGWRVFPLHEIRSGDCSCGRDACTSAGKHPRTKNGVKEATTDLAQITRWWECWPTANIGVATGIAEGATSGLYVIDVDTAKGATLESLERCDLSELLCSRIARTGSGGYHIYLSTDRRLPNTANRLAPFVDTRGEGGYVVAPPSHNRYGAYTWEAKNAVLPLPEATLVTLKCTRLVAEHAHQQGASHETLAPAATAAAPVAAARKDVAQEARNNFLISMAGVLRGRGLDAAEICAILSALNETRYGHGRHPQGPLALEELERTVFKSVAKWQEQLGVLPGNLPTIEQLTELMIREIPEPVWVVPELLSEGLVLLAGKPKLGKSWLVLDLALAVARGNDALVLGRYPVTRAGVLYLSLEDSPSRFQKRVNKLLNGRPVPSSFGYALSWKPLLAGGIEDLRTVLLSAPDTRLVIIDTLARVRTLGKSNGNAYQEDYALMAALQELALQQRVTLLLVHHVRKMESDDPFDMISGSTGLPGGADAGFVLKRERGQREASLNLTGRDVGEQELALTFDPDACTWTVTGTAAERQVSQSRKEVLDLLEQNGAMTPAAIARELEKPRTNVKGMLQRLKKEGVVETDREGRYMVRKQDAE